MPNSPYDIKEKLLQALDHEYNVVDMAAVLEVIAALEKAYITKEALERTRIGRYINELRKKTPNEQLARRAKNLVKSWRKLLPPRMNGDVQNVPGNGEHESLSVPATPQYKASSPLFLGEQSSSPLFSSASSSPLLNSVYQGSNLPFKFSPDPNEQMSPHGSNSSKSNRSFVVLSSPDLICFENVSPSQKRKRSFEKLGEMIASLPSGSKLPKVKTTQQLIAELHAKQKAPSIDCLHKKIQPLNSNFCSSVIKKDLDLSACIYQRDSVEHDIYRILSTLPPISASDINLEEENLPTKCTSVSNDHLNRLSEIWEYVNGIYDCNGFWRTWNECCEQKSLGESILLLPYVNID